MKTFWKALLTIVSSISMFLFVRWISSHQGEHMATDTAKGQEKLHRVNNADGTPVADTGNGEGYMTQEQLKNRDKSLGLVRVDEASGDPVPDQELPE